jgi:hypothetical protein
MNITVSGHGGMADSEKHTLTVQGYTPPGITAQHGLTVECDSEAICNFMGHCFGSPTINLSIAKFLERYHRYKPEALGLARVLRNDIDQTSRGLDR